MCTLCQSLPKIRRPSAAEVQDFLEMASIWHALPRALLLL